MANSDLVIFGVVLLVVGLCAAVPNDASQIADLGTRVVQVQKEITTMAERPEAVVLVPIP